MAQPTSFRLQYLGSVEVVANEEYSAADFLTLFPTASIFVLKTKTTRNDSVKVSINQTVPFEIEYNETSAFDGTSVLKYVFNRDCVIAVAKEL